MAIVDTAECRPAGSSVVREGDRRAVVPEAHVEGICRSGQTPSPNDMPACQAAAAEAAALFRALGDATRALILLNLRSRDRCVTELAKELGMTSPATCHHLQILRHEGLVTATRAGREVIYAVDEHNLRRRLRRSLTQIGATKGSALDTAEPILIGSALPLTGFAAADGLEQKRALELAIERWNARGGVHGRHVDHVILDIGDMSEKRMLYCFETLINEYAVDAILNGYLIYTGPEHEIIRQSMTPYVHSNTSTVNWQMYSRNRGEYWMCFQCDPSNRAYGTGFPRFLNYLERRGRLRPRGKQVAVLSASDPYSDAIAQALQDSLKSVGWDVCLYERIEAPNEDWGRILDKLGLLVPDVVFLSDVVLEDNISFVESFLERPTPSLVYGQYAPTLREFVDTLGSRAEGTVTSTVGGILPGALGDEYSSAYLDRWHVHPGKSVGGLVYDEVDLYLTAVALAEGPEDRRRVCECLASLWVRGTTGVRQFTCGHVVPSYPHETRDPAAGMPHLVTQVQDGVPRILYPPPYVEAEYVPPPWSLA